MVTKSDDEEPADEEPADEEFGRFYSDRPPLPQGAVRGSSESPKAVSNPGHHVFGDGYWAMV